MRDLIEEITGERWPKARTKNPEIVKWHEDTYAIAEVLGLCAFTCTSAQAILPKDMTEIFNLATGSNLSEGDIMMAAERILAMEKCFNVREGADRKLDDLPYRMMNEPIQTGVLRGMVTSKEWLDEALDRYYALHEWDPVTSWPYRETMDKLGLSDVAAQLERVVSLPKKRS
jgi:aldehyde:ferredoxin oxidoreductase